jgi:hypothetical protein
VNDAADNFTDSQRGCQRVMHGDLDWFQAPLFLQPEAMPTKSLESPRRGPSRVLRLTQILIYHRPRAFLLELHSVNSPREPSYCTAIWPSRR